MQVTDQVGRKVRVSTTPERIVSLVPSITELICDLNLVSRVKGITDYCVHPARDLKGISRIGGTKNFDEAQILHLKPDLILANKEENPKEKIDRLADKVPVWVSDVPDYVASRQMIQSIGEITGTSQTARQWLERIDEQWTKMPQLSGQLQILYFIWKDPWMVAGGDTFIHSLLSRLGFVNLAANQKRYPVWQTADILASKADWLFLSSEPYPFKETDAAEMKHKFSCSNICLVPGDYFSWYGSRLLKSIPYFRALIQMMNK